MTRVVVIGLDGATWNLLTPWIEQGALPAISTAMRNGTWGNLRSTTPPLSPPAWATFLTGKNPGKHGIYSFTVRTEDYAQVPANGSYVRSETLAEIVSRHGRRAIQLNVPMTYPPRQVNGIWVSGLDTPSSEVPFASPADAALHLKQRFGYDIEATLRHTPGEEAEFIAAIENVERNRAKAALHLFATEPWDLYVVVFRGIDILSHFFWRYLDTTHPCYNPDEAARYGHVLLEHHKWMDSVVDEFLQALPDDTTLVVVSDHGFGPHLRWVYLDNLFASLGLIRWGKQAAVTSLRSLTSAFMQSRLAAVSRKLLPVQLRRAMGETVRRSLPEIDWARSLVYPVEGQGLVRLNVRGRDPLGCVSPGDEYERILEMIVDELMRLRDPVTQETVVDRVQRWEDIYGGRTLDSPDLWIEWKEGYMAQRGGDVFSTRIFSDYETSLSGNHRMQGVLLAQGAGIRKGKEIEGAGIVDMAPTLLHLLGLPIPDDMDGNVLLGMLRDGYPPVVHESASPYTQQVDEHPFSSDEQDIIVERLEGLGYL